jgi:hypothetical protein
MKDQFVISLPAGWSVFDQQEVLTGKRAKTGPPVIFSAEEIDGRAMMSGDQQTIRKVMEQMAGVEVGRIAGFMLQRLPAKRGMSCTGFDSNATKSVLGLLSTDPMFGKGRKIREEPHADPVAIGGCQGLRVRGKGTASTGEGKNLDVFAVSDGEVLYLAMLLNLDKYYPSNLPAFEQALSTFRLAAAPEAAK